MSRKKQSSNILRGKTPNNSSKSTGTKRTIDLSDELKAVHAFIEQHQREIVVPLWRRCIPFTI
jgi:hypothetical protein